MNPGPAASFRDPAGRVFRAGPRILRAVNAEGEASIRKLRESAAGKRLLQRGDIIRTEFLSAAETESLLGAPEIAGAAEGIDCRAVVEHEPAPFPNYPHEWAPEMLHAAGLLTLDLAEALLPEGLGLKDANPWNVMFWGARPVFLDALSFEERDPRDPTWLANAQFVRTFLLPLMAGARFGIGLDRIFTTSREGFEPEHLYRMLGTAERLRPRNALLVSIPVWLGRLGGERDKIYEPRRVKDPEQARFILRGLLRAQRRRLNGLEPRARRSGWSEYMAGNNNYSAEQMRMKADFVRAALAEAGGGDVLDIGCNTGTFSRLAAESGSRVVAIDSDAAVVGRVWRSARETKAAILPLVVNLAQPSPPLGWANRECRAFLERAEGAFDVVMMLALIHHLLVTERIPLPEILGAVRRMTRRWAIVEYVGSGDSMFRHLCRGRAHLHKDFTNEAFENAARRHFRIARRTPLPGGERILYLLSAEK